MCTSRIVAHSLEGVTPRVNDQAPVAGWTFSTVGFVHSGHRYNVFLYPDGALLYSPRPSQKICKQIRHRNNVTLNKILLLAQQECRARSIANPIRLLPQDLNGD